MRKNKRTLMFTFLLYSSTAISGCLIAQAKASTYPHPYTHINSNQSLSSQFPISPIHCESFFFLFILHSILNKYVDITICLSPLTTLSLSKTAWCCSLEPLFNKCPLEPVVLNLLLQIWLGFLPEHLFP